MKALAYQWTNSVMRVLAAVGIVVAALTSFACGTETGSENGRIYAAAISAALANDEFFFLEDEPFPLPDAPLYVSPSIQIRYDRHSFRKVPMPSDDKEVIRARFPDVRLAEPTASPAIYVRVHHIERLGARRQVEVSVFNGEVQRGHAAEYLLEPRGIQWRVVSAGHRGFLIS